MYCTQFSACKNSRGTENRTVIDNRTLMQNITIIEHRTASISEKFDENMTISVKRIVMKISLILNKELQVYQEIQRKHDNQYEIDGRKKYHCH